MFLNKSWMEVSAKKKRFMAIKLLFNTSFMPDTKENMHVSEYGEKHISDLMQYQPSPNKQL